MPGHSDLSVLSPAIDPFTSASGCERSGAGPKAAPMLRVNAGP